MVRTAQENIAAPGPHQKHVQVYDWRKQHHIRRDGPCCHYAELQSKDSGSTQHSVTTYQVHPPIPVCSQNTHTHTQHWCFMSRNAQKVLILKKLLLKLPSNIYYTYWFYFWNNLPNFYKFKKKKQESHDLLLRTRYIFYNHTGRITNIWLS